MKSLMAVVCMAIALTGFKAGNASDAHGYYSSWPWYLWCYSTFQLGGEYFAIDCGTCTPRDNVNQKIDRSWCFPY